MSHAFKASKLIGLLALVLGLMAFGATAAQAELGAYWELETTEGGKTKILDGTLLPKFQSKKETHITFLTKVGLSKVEILCSEILVINGQLHELGRLTGKIHLEGCTTKLNGTTAAACTPKSPGASLGLIETNAIEGLLKLHELEGGTRDDLLKLSPVVGLTFVTLELGATCAIGSKFDVTGHIYLKDCENKLLVNQLEHLFEVGPLSTFQLGANSMTIDGSFWMFLVGTHAGMKFSGHPF